MRDTEKLEQMLDQIEVMASKIDHDDAYQSIAWSHLKGASEHISAAIRQEQINDNVDFCATLEEV